MSAKCLLRNQSLCAVLRWALITEAPELFPAGFHYQEKAIAIMQC
ncbi:Hypothetical protein ABZS17H1_01040 [Kosakonia cowanii]